MAVNGLGRPPAPQLTTPTTSTAGTSAVSGRGAATQAPAAAGQQDTFTPAAGGDAISQANAALEKMNIPTMGGEVDPVSALGPEKAGQLKSEYQAKLQGLKNLPPEEQKKEAGKILQDYKLKLELAKNQRDQIAKFSEQQYKAALDRMNEAMKD